MFLFGLKMMKLEISTLKNAGNEKDSNLVNDTTDSKS